MRIVVLGGGFGGVATVRHPYDLPYDLPYDHLVVALGASTNDRLIPGSSLLDLARCGGVVLGGETG